MNNNIEIITMTNPRNSIINSYSQTIEDSFKENRSQIKLINFGTGSGKTHALFQSMYETIKKYPTIQIIGVYVAPLREHLKIPVSLKESNPDISVYTINSLEMKTMVEFLDLYKKWIPSILKNKKVWCIDPKKYPIEKIQENKDNIQENKDNLSKVRSVINRMEILNKIDFGDEKFSQYQLQIAKQDLDKLIGQFLEFLIKSQPDENSWIDECLKLVEIFYPLYLLRKKSGILMLTCDKFNTAVPYFKFNGETWVKKNLHLHEYVALHTSNTTKFILAFDEQEDSYQKMLNKMIDIISPQTLAINNALSSINREFSILFSNKSEENRKLLKFLDKNPSAYYEFEEYLEKNQTIDQKWIELAKIYQRLTFDEGNSPNFLKNMVKINQGFEKSLEEIASVFEVFESQKNKPITFDFEILHKVLSKFENNRTLLIPYDIYEKIGDDLMNIFSFNDLYIYNIEPLKKLFLTKRFSGHVCVTEQKTQKSTSLAELVYVIFAVRLQIKTIKKFLNNVLNAEDSQSRSLEIWSKHSKIQKMSQEDLMQKSNYLDRSYVYDSYKSITNIMEISRYQNPENNLISHELREVSIGSTSIRTSPEKTINTMVTGSNVIFLISATGGILGDLSTSFDMSYLEDSLRDKKSGLSSFKTMTEQEIRLCEEIRNYRQSKRKITVDFFNEELKSYPNVKTQKVVERFDKLVLKCFIDSQTSDIGWFSIYKIQELKGFIRFLFYLFEDDSIQETFAFTQSLRWIKNLIRYCEFKKDRNYHFEQSQEHPAIYYVQVNHQRYKSNLRIKLILFDAKFNEHYTDKTVKRTYSDELHEKEGQKLFLISAYASASKGFNPIVTTKDGDEKDFDSLVLLMDSYYTKMRASKSKKEKEKEHEQDSGETFYHFALMKNLVSGNPIEIKDFTKYLQKHEAKEFRQNQHQLLLGKGILQAIGRIERRDFSKQITKIFINEETRKNLVIFHKYLENEELDEVHKLSINNYEVYLRVKEEEKKHIISDYDDHVYDEIEAFLAFHQFRQTMLAEIENFHHSKNTFAITTAWDALRDSIAFKNPKDYLMKLKKTGLFPGDFIESLFYETTEQAFTPYLASEDEDGEKFHIISDSINGKRIYPYYGRLYPEYLKTFDVEFDSEWVVTPHHSTERICRLYRQLIPQPEIFKNYIPRPNFFYDVLYPSLTENFVEGWIKEVIFSGKERSYGFEQLVDFKRYHKLYEKFDLYYLKGDELFCIDVKAWSMASGYRLSKETVQKTQDKLEAIISDYSDFSQVKGLLLNLHAAKEKNHKHSKNLFSGNLIFSDHQHFPVESSILKNFLFSKEKI